MSQSATPWLNKSAVHASFEVAQIIAKKGKPHTNSTAAKIMVSSTIGDKTVKEISQIPLSNTTV